MHRLALHCRRTSHLLGKKTAGKFYNYTLGGGGVEAGGGGEGGG